MLPKFPTLFPILFLTVGLWCTGTCSAARGALEAPAAGDYAVRFEAELKPSRGVGVVALRVAQSQAALRELRIALPEPEYAFLSADGEFSRTGDEVRWQVPPRGGVLRYEHRVRHVREAGEIDAELSREGALFRGDDLFPPVRTRFIKGAQARAEVLLNVPKGWSAWTQYGAMTDGPQPVVHAGTRFPRPTGWMIAGRLGVRLDEVADRTFAVAAWQGSGVRRNDVLAFLRLHFAPMLAVTQRFPERLLVVSADDPFWRGGLSARRSFYLHADRPLISENGTSTVLHELFHVAFGLHAEPGADWLIEGFAEYYSLELMRRRGTISERRFAAAVERLRDWGRQAPRLDVRNSKGPVTARAVTVLADLDAVWAESEVARAERLDRVVAALAAAGEPLTLKRFQSSLRAAQAPAAVFDQLEASMAPTAAD
ncbi:MAG: hypothetical protein AAF918_05940 [Pseudomonadota bacterium]